MMRFIANIKKYYLLAGISLQFHCRSSYANLFLLIFFLFLVVLKEIYVLKEIVVEIIFKVVVLAGALAVFS